MRRPDLVAISGSRRDGSYTRRALRIALDAAADSGAETELLDLREVDLPPFDPDADEGETVYHGSYSATLKDALDYCGKEEFEDTTVGLLAVAGGGSYASALDHLRVVVRTIHGNAVPHQVGIRGASGKFDGDDLTDDSLDERVRELGRGVTRYAAVDPTLPVELSPSCDDD